MKRSTLALVAVMSVVSVVSIGRAEEAKTKSDVATYLDKLQLKLEHTAQRANQPTSSGSAVAGLRGSKQEPVSKQLYWKGKTGNAPVTVEEVKLFRTAIEEAKAGQNDKAMASLHSFIEKYPNSGLVGDAADTLKLLAATPATAPTPVPVKS